MKAMQLETLCTLEENHQPLTQLGKGSTVGDEPGDTGAEVAGIARQGRVQLRRAPGSGNPTIVPLASMDDPEAGIQRRIVVGQQHGRAVDAGSNRQGIGATVGLHIK